MAKVVKCIYPTDKDATAGIEIILESKCLVIEDFFSGSSQVIPLVNCLINGAKMAIPNKLKEVLNIATIIAGSVQFNKAASLLIPNMINGKKINVMPPVNTLNKTWTRAVRLTETLEPMEAKATVAVVPIFCPITSAMACSKPMVPVARIVIVVAIAALDDCIIIVITMPTRIRINLFPTPSSVNNDKSI